MAIEIVPMNNGDFPQFFVWLPEGIQYLFLVGLLGQHPVLHVTLAPDWMILQAATFRKQSMVHGVFDFLEIIEFI